MESINLAVLSGILNDDAEVIVSGDSTLVASFEIVTYHCIGRGKDKKRVREVHEVELANPGTISKFLKKGKSITIQGRVRPMNGILATSVHFPASRTPDE